MTSPGKSVFIVAGEASGDLNAQSLVHELKQASPGIKLYGIGGEKLKAEGVEILIDYKEINFIGFTAVVKNLSVIKGALRTARDKIRELNPAVVILVDFPGFNLKLAEMLRKFYTGKIIYYISPQVWAWHKSRVKKIRKYIDKMLVVFPFEVDFYKKEGVEAVFTGHPLVERINDFLSRNSRRETGKVRIGLLPGSRKEEVERILPAISLAAEKLAKEFNAEVNLICSQNIDENVYKDILGGLNFNLVYNKEGNENNYLTMLNSDFLITKSGTSTVECALIGSPFCVVYKAGKINYAIGKSLIKVKFLAMVNILSGKEIVKEFIQNEMSVESIYNEGKRVLTDTEYRRRIVNDLNKLRDILTDKPASKNAASVISEIISSSTIG